MLEKRYEGDEKWVTWNVSYKQYNIQGRELGYVSLLQIRLTYV